MGGLYGRALLDDVTVNILAVVLIRYSDKWLLITYKSLLQSKGGLLPLDGQSLIVL